MTRHQAGKPRYRVDLSDQQACCEANYARLLKLMPDADNKDHWSYRVDAVNRSACLQIRVVERAPYTTMLEVSQEDSLKQWSDPLRLQVRLYHDANMAEVVAWQNYRPTRSRYDYPNQDMFHQDEKAQINRFLGDWLAHSQANGHVPAAIGL